MKNQHLSILTALVCVLYIAPTYGKTTPVKKEETLQLHTEEFKKSLTGVTSSITDSDMVTSARENNQERTIAELARKTANTQTAAIKAELEAIDVQLDRDKKNFIKQNVPITYIIMGEQAVKSYITSEFIEKPNRRVAPVTIAWEGSPDTLDVPIKPKPTLDELLVLDVEEKPIITAQAALSKPSPEKIRQDSMSILGLTEQDLSKLASEETKEVEVLKQPPVEVAPTITLHSGQITKLAIFGEKTTADLELYFKITRGINEKELTREISGVTQGATFNVNSVPFNVEGIDDKYIIIRNTLSLRKTVINIPQA
jgi:hypothetical protein